MLNYWIGLCIIIVTIIFNKGDFMKNCNLRPLKVEIEEVRNKINKMASQKNKLDTELVELSQKLDKILNKYYKVKYKNCN